MEREIKPQGVYRNFKKCIFEANLEGQGWQSRLITILLFLTRELRYPKKRGVNRKRGGIFGSCFAQEWGKCLTLGKKGLPGGQGVGENCTD